MRAGIIFSHVADVQWEKQNGLLRPPKGIVGVTTGEYRCPREGEYYVSGAVPTCYKASNDLTTPFNIVKLMRKVNVEIKESYDLVDYKERRLWK